MNDNGETILLCLVNNDPCSTILMTTSGQPLYSITTPNAHPAQPTAPHHRPSEDRASTHSASSSSSSIRPNHTSPCCSALQDGLLQPSVSPPSQDSDLPAVAADFHVRRGSETFVRRLDEVDITTGLIERTVGTIKEAEDETVTLELPGEKNFALDIPHLPNPYQPKEKSNPRRLRSTSPGSEKVSSGEDGGEDDEGGLERSSGGIESWDFEGPEGKQYKWFLLGNAPIMAFIDRTMSYPIARYRRAKLGIISRQRKGFLEVLPRGSVSMDLVVATFVGFMKTCVLPAQTIPPELEQNPPRIDSRVPQSPLPSWPLTAPSTMTEMQNGVRGASPSVMAPSIPSRFQSAASLARRHSRSPPAIALGLSPYSLKPRQYPTSGLTEHM